MRIKIDMPALEAAIVAELERQAPGVQLDGPVLATIEQAALMITSIQGWLYRPLSDEEQLATLDQHPGWEAA